MKGFLALVTAWAITPAAVAPLAQAEPPVATRARAESTLTKVPVDASAFGANQIAQDVTRAAEAPMTALRSGQLAEAVAHTSMDDAPLRSLASWTSDAPGNRLATNVAQGVARSATSDDVPATKIDHSIERSPAHIAPQMNKIDRGAELLRREAATPVLRNPAMLD